MAEADKDGRAAEIMGDLMACLSMSINESLRELRARVHATGPQGPTTDTESGETHE